MDRHMHRAGQVQRQIGDDPLVAILGNMGDTIARLDAGDANVAASAAASSPPRATSASAIRRRESNPSAGSSPCALLCGEKSQIVGDVVNHGITE